MANNFSADLTNVSLEDLLTLAGERYLELVSMEQVVEARAGAVGKKGITALHETAVNFTGIARLVVARAELVAQDERADPLEKQQADYILETTPPIIESGQVLINKLHDKYAYLAKPKGV